MFKTIKHYVVGSVLVGASLLSSCGNSSVPPNPNGPVPTNNPDCIVGSAVEYASDLDLGLDVGVFDSNLNRSNYDSSGVQCFTKHEKAMIDELSEIKSEGADPLTLQKIINDYPNAGPATVYALRASWDATLVDQEFDTSLEFYDSNRLGWVAIDRATGISLPGFFLRDRGLDGMTPYPVDDNVSSAGAPDWNPNPGLDEISSFLDRFPGCEGLIGTGEGFPEFWQSSSDFLYADYLWGTPIPIRSALPPGAKVNSIIIGNRVTSFGDEYSDSTMELKYDVHPDDNNLIGFKVVYEFLAHMVPDVSNVSTDRDMWVFGKSDFGVSEGQILDADTIIAYQNPRVSSGARGIYDHTIFVDEKSPELVGFGPPFDTLRGFQSLDYLAAHTMLEVPKRFTAVPTEPRYADLSIHGCSYELD